MLEPGYWVVVCLRLGENLASYDFWLGWLVVDWLVPRLWVIHHSTVAVGNHLGVSVGCGGLEDVGCLTLQKADRAGQLIATHLCVHVGGCFPLPVA